MKTEVETVYVVRLFVEYEGQYFVGVFNDEDAMYKKIEELKKRHRDGKFVVDSVNMNEAEVKYF